MNRHARLNALLDFIATHGHVDVDKTARTLGVSSSTVRRDLNHLHDQQLVSRTHGGAVATSVSYDLPIRYRSSRQRSEKLRIAQAAAALVPPGAVVGLNGGTTTTEVARAIADQAVHTASEGPQVTILTNAINIAGELSVRRHVKLVMTGGVALPQSFELTGSLAWSTLRQVVLDMAIIGVDAFDLDLGAKALDEEEAGINRLMARQARRVVIVADSSKLTASAFALICPPAAVHDLVTDRRAPQDSLRRLADTGINVIAV
jgi:DeoR family transcriptional regulator, aga operon transcriptional repressor